MISETINTGCHSIEASTEAITLLSIHISMIAHTLTKTVECLRILEYNASALSKSQKFIQFPFHETFWNMVGSECISEFVPSDHMIS